MCNIALALALVLAAPADVELSATRLDGTAVTGALRGWESDHIVVATSQGEVQLAVDQLLSLVWSSTERQSERQSTFTDFAQVELTDGTLIPIQRFEFSGDAAKLSLSNLPADPPSTASVLRRQLAAVRLQALSAEAVEQWKEIRATEFASDVLVLLKRDGKSLDYVEGVLGDVGPKKIEFKLDGEALRVDREKVAGFIYYQGRASDRAETLCVVHGISGLQAEVAEAKLADGHLQMLTANNVVLKWPIADIDSIDFSAGKLTYLSDIEPASERWTPMVGLPDSATLAAEYGQPRRDQSAYGGPLTLPSDESAASPAAERLRTFQKGLALRSRTELVYRVPEGVHRFTAVAGIDPATTASGNVRLEIYGDDRLLVEYDIAGSEPPRPVEFDVAAIKRLKILVDYGRNLDTGDWLNLCDARFVK